MIMKRKFKILIGIIFIFLIANVSAQFTTGGGGEFSTGTGSAAFSNAQRYQPGYNFYSGREDIRGVVWPSLFDNPQDLRETCRDRKDFAIQIVPGGCKPMVVRSDLLAEQDVAVFCQMSAMQINPTIRPENIKNIMLTHVGNYSKGVSGVAYYHPARIFLSSYKTTQGYPSYDNIGYTIIRLKRQFNESGLPDFVEGTLNARIQYNIPYGFGLGMTEKIIPLMSDEEWAGRYPENVFLNGKAFMRVEALEAGRVQIGIYSDKEHKIDSFTLEKGKPIEKYLPGTGGYYCSLGYKATYVSGEVPKDKATIIFDKDKIDVYARDSFADGLCSISSITSYGGGTGQVSGNCRAYNGQAKGFTLKLGFNNALIDFLGADSAGYSIGNLLYEGSQDIIGTDTGNANRKVYLGGIGKGKNGNFAVLVALNSNEKFEDVKSKINDYVNTIKNNDIQTKEDTVSGAYNVVVIKQNEKFIFFGKEIMFNGFGGAVGGETTQDNEFNGLFESAVDGYKSVDENYGERDFDSGIEIGKYEKYGIAALTKAIELAGGVGKRGILIELTNLFKEKYPNENINLENDLVKVDTSGANVVIDLNGDTHVITLVRVEEPAKEKNGVDILLDNNPRSVRLGEYIMPANFAGNNDKSSIKLETFDESKILASGSCYSGNGFANQKIEIYTGSEATLCGHSIRVQKINLQIDAKIRLDPIINDAGSVVNISYKIGIEKRAFPLNPAKTADRISKLNDSINKWQNISDKLGTVVSGMKAACFVTSSALQVKNLFSNLGGKAIARQEVMSGTGGWDEMCGAALATEDKMAPEKYKEFMAGGSYNSIDDCYGKNANAIEKDVDYLTGKIKSQNEQIKSIQDNHKDGKGIDAETSRKEYAGIVESKLKGATGVVKEDPYRIDINGKTIQLNKINVADESFEDLRKIELYLDTLNSGTSTGLKKKVESQLYTQLNDVKQSSLNKAEANSATGLAQSSRQFAGVASVSIPHLQRGQSAELYKGLKLAEDAPGLKKGTSMQIIIDGGKSYYASLKPAGDGTGRYTIDKIFNIESDGKIGKDVSESKVNGEMSIADSLRSQHPQFQEINGDSYNNPIEDPEVRYFETPPYKGMPAIVPFDTRNGWYAAMKQTLPAFGNIETYQESGRVSSFWLCNVGKNSKIEFDKGVGDDICQMVNVFTGQPTNVFYGLSESEAKKKISDAQRAITDASNQYGPGVTKVNILGKTIKVGNSMVNQPGSRCQDFMSPSDCKILFNVCDPVICPSSRCNLGGKYYVDDVVQTGIVGSLFLCLPNVKEGIVVPVCLTGVHAGVDNYVSILRASRDCLQENLNSGGYVGICDEITAIYTCEFFWRQAGPIMKIIIPKLLEFTVGGGGTRGGGEYMNVQSAWNNMQKSIDYFNNNYAKNAIAAFRVRSTQEAGTPICKAFVSTQFPKKFKTLIEPDSPVQFSAWFDEIKMTSATVPATSQYKVFFHIYAGKDQGAYYSIYLKDSPGESFISSTSSVIFANGFVGKGEYVDQAVDKTAPAGFRQLCVRINTQENCGFKQVSTSFALNYVRDKYIEQEATKTNINSEKECISGASNALTMLNPNLEAGAQETLNPQIYSRGIIRICATDDPGQTTEKGRWQAVGYCDEQKVKCWLDKTSINGAITPGNAGARNATLSELNAQIDKYGQNERGALLTNEEGGVKFTEIEKQIIGINFKTDLQSMIAEKEIIFARFSELENGYTLDDQQKARILFDKSYVYDVLARKKWKMIEAERQKKEEARQTTSGGAGRTGNGEFTVVAAQINNIVLLMPKLPNRDSGVETKIRNILSKKSPPMKINREIKDWTKTSLSGWKKETLWVAIGLYFGTSGGVTITGAGENTYPHTTGCHPDGDCIDINYDGPGITIYREFSSLSNPDWLVKYGFPKNAIKIVDEAVYTSEKSTGKHYHIEVNQQTMKDFIARGNSALASSSSIPGSSNDRILAVCNYFKRKGYSDILSAGIIGNLVQESNLEPAKIGYGMCPNNRDAYGIAQWCDSRYSNLIKYAGNKKTDYRTLITQLDFIDYELNNNYREVLISLNNAQDIDSATSIYLNKYEVADPNSLNKRINYANSAYIICTTSPSSSTTSIGTSTTTSATIPVVPGRDADLKGQIAMMIMTVPSQQAKDNKVGGIILLGNNFIGKTDSQIKTITGQYPNAKIIAVDIEGENDKNGKTGVNRFALLQTPKNYLFADELFSKTKLTVYQNSFLIGNDMKSLGFNLDLAPVLDVSSSGFMKNSRRSMGETSDIVKSVAPNYILGLQDGGVGATGKHFPGYGDENDNSDLREIKVTWQVTKINDYISVFDSMKGDLDAIMMSNILYLAYDSANPAVFSEKIVDMARQGFDGIIITDDLNAKSVDGTTDCSKAGNNALKAIKAGNDVLININSNCVDEMINAVFAAANNNNNNNGDALKTQINNANIRIEAFSKKYPR